MKVFIKKSQRKNVKVLNFGVNVTNNYFNNTQCNVLETNNVLLVTRGKLIKCSVNSLNKLRPESGRPNSSRQRPLSGDTRAVRSNYPADRHENRQNIIIPTDSPEIDLIFNNLRYKLMQQRISLKYIELVNILIFQFLFDDDIQNTGYTHTDQIK